jgi:modulator of FtsH protease
MQFQPTFGHERVVLSQQQLHTILRKTYSLLSITLLWSAAIAYYGIVSNASFGSAMVASILGLITLFFIKPMRGSRNAIWPVFLFTGCLGYSLGPMLNSFLHGMHNGGYLIMTALAGTGLTFFACSAYAIISRRDLSHWGKTLMTGLIVVLVASLANLFFKLPAIQLAIASVSTIISAFLIMMDTSRIINQGETDHVLITIALFLDILMLFQNLLYLLGAFSDRER